MRPNGNDQGFLASYFEFVNSNFINEPRPNVAKGHERVFTWTVETKIIKQVAQAGLAPDEREIEQVSANTGMNGVVPAWRLKELLDIPRFKDERDAEEAAELERLKREAPGATLDAATGEEVSPPSNDENPTHREDFRRLVDVAARKPEPKD